MRSKNDYIRYRVNPFDRLFHDLKVKLLISNYDISEYYIYSPRNIKGIIGYSEYPNESELKAYEKALGKYNKELWEEFCYWKVNVKWKLSTCFTHQY